MRIRSRSFLSFGLAALMTIQSILPVYADSSTRLINDLQGAAESSPEANADRDWNGDLLAIAKAAWQEDHRDDNFIAPLASPASLGREAASLEDYDDVKARNAVTRQLRKPDGEIAAASGKFISKMLRQAVIPEAGIPREDSLTKEIPALLDMNDEEFVVFHSGDGYMPETGDIVFLSNRKVDEKAASGGSLKKATGAPLQDSENGNLMKEWAKSAVMGGIVFDVPEETADEDVAFLYGAPKDGVEAGLIGTNDKRIIGYASVETLHAKYCTAIKPAGLVNVSKTLLPSDIWEKEIKVSYGYVYFIYSIGENDALQKDLYINEELIKSGIEDFCADDSGVYVSVEDELLFFDPSDMEWELVADEMSLYDLSINDGYIYGIDSLRGLAQLYAIGTDDYTVYPTNFTAVNNYKFENNRLQVEIAVPKERYKSLEKKKISISAKKAMAGAEEIEELTDGINNITKNSKYDSDNVPNIISIANVKFAELQSAVLDLPRLWVNQLAWTGTHADKNAYDLDCANGYLADIKAPFDGTVRFTENSEHAVWFESDNNVLYANGTVAKMTVLTMHHDDISVLYPGKKFKQGEIYVKEGNYGNSFGAHLHIECINGDAGSYAWNKRGSVLPNEALFLSKTTRIDNAGGVNWKVYNGNISVIGPEILDVQVSDVTSAGYYITATVKQGTYPVTHVVFPTWTETGGQDDMINLEPEGSTVINSTTKRYHRWVSDNDFNYKKDTYYSDVWAYDPYWTPGSEGHSDWVYKAGTAKLVNSGVRGNTYKITWNGHTYYFLEDNLTWDEARKACEAQGGHLATITSAAEQDAITQGIISTVMSERQQLRIGGTYKNGKLEWVTGETGNYYNWASNQPDSGDGSEWTVAAFTGYTGFSSDGRVAGTWNDLSPNDTKMGYILEIDPEIASVKLDVNALYLNGIGTSCKLSVTVTPDNAANKTVVWNSSNPSVASVSSNGTVKALKEGKTVISVTTLQGNKVAKCDVTVDAEAVSELSLTPKNVTVTEGDITSVHWSISGPSAGTSTGEVWEGNVVSHSVSKSVVPPDQFSISWTSSNTSVARVISDGKIKGIKEGSAIITVKSKHGNKKATCIVTVKSAKDAVTGIKLDKTVISLDAGKTQKLNTTVSPSNAADKSVIWKSSNTNIATVSSDGTVKAVAPGTATITATTKDGGKTATCKVTVTRPVTGVKLSKTSATVQIGKTIMLSTTISPSDASNKNVTWKSSNTKVATVTTDGTVKAVAAGTATITATTKDGGKTAACKVTVSAPQKVTGVKLSKTSAMLAVGKTLKLSTTISPDNASNKSVTWKSSNTKVATVSGGTVKALAVGTAVITVTTKDGGKTAACKITVPYPMTDGWHEIDGKKYYYKDGVPLTGFQKIGSDYYYFTPGTGVMKKGEFTVNKIPCYFDASTGKGLHNGWRHINGKDYWYERGQRQGTRYDKNGVLGDGTIRGREIYDPKSKAWYWLDAVYDGAKAVNKEVWMPYVYQNEKPGSTDGKWVRYNSKGGMVKGWYTNKKGTYYYDRVTGAMLKGYQNIDGKRYRFDPVTGILQR